MDDHRTEEHNRRATDPHAEDMRNMASMMEVMMAQLSAQQSIVPEPIKPAGAGWLPHIGTLAMVASALLTVYVNINNSLITTANDIRNLQKTNKKLEQTVEKYEGDLKDMEVRFATMKSDLEFQTSNSSRNTRDITKRLRALEKK